MSIIQLTILEEIFNKPVEQNSQQTIQKQIEDISKVYSSNILSYQELFNYFIQTRVENLKIWITQQLSYQIEKYYVQYPDKEKILFRTALFFIIDNKMTELMETSNNNSSNTSLNTFNPLLNQKFAQLIIIWLKYDYPDSSNTFFNDFMSRIYKLKDKLDLMISLLSLFADILLCFDSELIKFTLAHDNNLKGNVTKIKDDLRDNSVVEIITLINETLKFENMLPTNSKQLISKFIKVISQFIDWNILTLFSDSISLVFSLIQNPLYVSECLRVVDAIIKKGMANSSKLEIIKKLNISSVIESCLKQGNISNDTISSLCMIITDLGIFIIEYKKEFKNLNSLPQEDLTIFEINCCIMIMKAGLVSYKDKKILTEFLSKELNYLKVQELIVQNNIELFKNLILIVEQNLLIPLEISIDKSDKESIINTNTNIDNNTIIDKCDIYYDYRKELQTIYQNFYSIKCIKPLIIQSIELKFEALLKDYYSFSLQSIELPLQLLSTIKEVVKDNEDVVVYKNLIKPLLKLQDVFKNISSDSMIILYFETITKYIFVYSKDTDTIKDILDIFFGNKGIFNENPQTGGKVCQVLLKFIDKTKQSVANLSKSLISKIYEILNILVGKQDFNVFLLYASLFEVLGLLISQKYIEISDKIANIRMICELFYNSLNIFINSSNTCERFITMMKIIANFLQHFNTEAPQDIKDIIMQLLEIILKKFYPIFKSQNGVTKAILLILQKLIVIIGKNLVPLIECFFLGEIKYPSEEIYLDSIKLLQNLSLQVKKDSLGIISKVLYFYYERIKSIERPKNNLTEYEKTVNLFFLNFNKLIGMLATEIPESFYSKALENIDSEELMQYVIGNTIEIGQYETKKLGIKMMRNILDFSIKIIRQGESEDKYQIYYKYINTIILGTFKVLKNISLRDENFDKNVLVEILGIHSSLCKSIPNFYINYLNTNLMNYNHETALGLMEKLVLASNNKNQNVNDISSLLNILVLNQKEDLKI